MWRRYDRRVYAADEGGAAGGQAAAAAAAPAGSGDPAAAATAAAAAQPAAAAAAAPASIIPSGLPDHLRGANDQETVSKLWDAAKGYRDQVATRGTVPDSPTGYNLQFDEKLSAVFGDPGKDPAVQLFLEKGQKHGIPDKQMRAFVTEYLSDAIEKGIVKRETADPLDEARAVFGDAAKTMPEAELKTKFDARIAGVNDWVDGLARQSNLNGDEAAALKTMATLAPVLTALEKISKLGPREHGLQPGGQPGGPLTKVELDAMRNDPRADSNSASFEIEYYRKVQAGYQQLYGGKAA